ncbi:hypothetical protein C2S51_009140 [Perilla frutescens var. frutescens]|nr:hypothetical protein C2S51_009140 [Perilla frutescens var. frutescens]
MAMAPPSCGGNCPADSATSSSEDSSDIIVCKEHQAADWFVSKCHSNPFRYFIRCPERENHRCTFARWIDPIMSLYQKGRVQLLMREKEALQISHDSRAALVEVLTENSRLKDAELEWLRSIPRNGEIVYWCVLISAIMFVINHCFGSL